MAEEIMALYVDDDEFSRQVVEMLFKRKLGFENIAVFADSEDFMERVENLSFKPNLILLDIHIDPIDGFEMLSLLRDHEQYSDVKTAAITASVMVEEVERLREAGFDGALSKPIDPEYFGKFLHGIMNGEKIWEI